MIQAKELRFGNKVQTPQGEIITVQQILNNTVIYDTQIEVSREATTSRGSYNMMSYSTQLSEVIKEVDYHDIEPIALTPQILKQCGFRNFLREEWIFSFGNTHIDFEFTEEGLRLRRPAPPRDGLKYLHQLQNFLFAIADYELEPELDSIEQ